MWLYFRLWREIFLNPFYLDAKRVLETAKSHFRPGRLLEAVYKLGQKTLVVFVYYAADLPLSQYRSNGFGGGGSVFWLYTVRTAVFSGLKD